MGGAVLINSSTGKPEWVDSAHVKEAVENGSHYSKTGRVNVKSTETGASYNTSVKGSQQVGIEAESVGAEIKRDYDEAERARFDNPYDKFVAATEGFASSITFGAADILMDDYSTRMRADVNSGWRTFGEVTGIIAPTVATLGTSTVVGNVAKEGAGLLKGALKNALAHTPAGIGSRIATKAGEKLGTKLLEGSIRQKVAAAAVESAVEGAMWNTGQQLSEAIIEDKEFSAEALLGSITEGAAYGASIGGAFAGAGAAIKAFKGRKGKNVHALFDLDSDVSHAFRNKMAGSADEAIRYGDDFSQRLQDLNLLALRGGKADDFNQQFIAAQKGMKEYDKAKDGYRKMLGLKPGHSAQEAQDALYELMKKGGKNDIIEFAKRLDGLHSATAKVDDLLRVEGKLDDSLLQKTDEVGGYQLPPRSADELRPPRELSDEDMLAWAGEQSARDKAAKSLRAKMAGAKDEAADSFLNPPSDKTGNLRGPAKAQPIGGMKRDLGTMPLQTNPGGNISPIPHIAEYANQANTLRNQIAQQAHARSANYAGSFSPRKYTDEIQDLADNIKDEHGAKFKAMDGLYIADALGMDVNKVPVLGPVADSFLKLWVFYRMGGMIGNSKIVQKGGKSRLAREVLEHAIAAKAGNIAYKKGGAAGGAAGYQVGKFGVRAALDGIGNIGAHTSKMGDRIRSAVDKVMTPGVKKTIKKATPALVFQLSNAAYSAPLDTDPKDDYGRIAAQLERSAHDQGSLQNYLNSKYEDARILDAGLADELVKRTMAQMQYLEKKLPKAPVTWPMGMPWKPPASEMVAFKQAAAIHANPSIIMDKMEAGTLQQTEVEDLAALWPAVHAQLLDKVMDSIHNVGALGTKEKKVVSIITGTTLVSSVDPWLISYTQESFKKAKNEEESHNATIAGANSVKAGTATPGQQYGMGPSR